MLYSIESEGTSVILCLGGTPSSTYISTGKSGVLPDKASELAIHVVETCPNLELMGLMTIGAFDHDLSKGPNPDFQVRVTF